MKQRILIFVIIAITYALPSQSQLPYESYRVKEYYDYLDVKNKILTGGYPGFIDANSGASPGSEAMADELGERLNDVITSELRMFQATKDKAYLIKFINWAIKTQSIRRDNLNPSLHPGWVALAPGHSIYRDGRILAALAEFAFRIKWDTDLAITPLPQQLIIIPTNFTGKISTLDTDTYGRFANWLLERIFETLDWYDTNNYFNSEGYKNSYSSDEPPLTINMQATFGSALIFTGLAYPDQLSHPKLVGYRAKANLIAGKYKSFLNLKNYCTNLFPIPCNPTRTYSNPLLRYDPGNDTYWWFARGWQVREDACTSVCINKKSDDIDHNLEFIEDISHASQTLKFPLAVNEIYAGVFYDQDMVRWRNMFTKKVWDPGLHGFHGNVLGNENQISTCSSFNCFDDIALSYMAFNIFDGYSPTATSPNVYEIIMDYYIDHFHGAFRGYQGVAYLGISEIVKAQWNKECVNLTLYNRNLVYNQDFYVKNTLVVDPTVDDDFHTPGDKAFADPSNLSPGAPDHFNRDEFIVESGVISKMTAGEEIILKPGFSAKAGSVFTAAIDQNICSDGRAADIKPTPFEETDPALIATTNQQQQINKDAELNAGRQEIENTEIIPSTFEFEIFPNPGNGIFNIQLRNETNREEVYSLTIYDYMGTIILKQQLSNSDKIDISERAKGIYHVKIESGSEMKTKKIVLE